MISLSSYTNLPDKVFRNVAEVIWSWHIGMAEQICLWIFRLVAISEEQLEKVEKTEPV